jgi:hypothetical protein
MASTADDNGVTLVEFFIDGGSIGVDGDASDGGSAIWNLTGVVDGDYTITANATDTIGQTASHSIVVTLNNGVDPPTGGGDLHVHDLSGSSASGKGGKWHVTVTVDIWDHTDPGAELRLANATVEGVWSGAFDGIEVTNVILDGFTYAPDYHAPDAVDVWRP